MSSVIAMRLAESGFDPVNQVRLTGELVGKETLRYTPAGIPILDALGVICEEMTNKQFRRVLEEIQEGLRGGDTFAGAVAKHPEAFPPFYLGILRSAELTGNLDTVLNFVPKLIVVGICLALFGSAILMLLVDFTQDIFARIPELVQ